MSESNMLNVRDGLVQKGQPGYDAPEFTAESLAAKATSRAATERSHALVDDDASFNKETIREALLAPDGIQAGLTRADDIVDPKTGRTRAEVDADVEWMRSSGILNESTTEGVVDESADAQYGRAARRQNEIVGPAMQTLAEEFDDGERARAWAVLDLTEKQHALQAGIVDEEEVEDLERGAAEALTLLQQASHALAEATRNITTSQNRQERFDALVQEFRWSPAEARQVLALTAQMSADAGLDFANMPPQAWETAVRSTVGVVAAEDAGRRDADFKNQVLHAPSTSIAEGLTYGEPYRLPVIQPQPDYRLVDSMASGRVSPGETDDEIRESVRSGSPITNGIKAVVRGAQSQRSDGSFEAAQAKARALGFEL